MKQYRMFILLQNTVIYRSDCTECIGVQMLHFLITKIYELQFNNNGGITIFFYSFTRYVLRFLAIFLVNF